MSLGGNLRAPVRLLIIGAVGVIACAGFSGSASAVKLKTLHSFCSQANCADGKGPGAAVVMDAAGGIFGTTELGGLNGGGTVFELLFTGTRYKFHVLYNFCGQPGCADGTTPVSSLILDNNGNLYGTTTGGGAHDGGTVFELVPNAKHTKATLTTLYDFCAQPGCADGNDGNAALTYAGAETGALYDGTSPLFGTTLIGGAANQGVAFQLTAVTGQTQRNETVLYSFCSKKHCKDGARPNGLTPDGNGNFFGTTRFGGTGTLSVGVVFELSPASSGFSETVLYNFCQLADCADGDQPAATVVLDAKGRLLGTAAQGDSGNGGVLFRLVPNGGASQEAVLHSFCSDATCSDGATPQGPVVRDAKGSMFGTTTGGGNASDGGVIYQRSGLLFGALYSFCAQPNCTDGQSPLGGLVISQRNLFGTTALGGTNNGGTVYELKR